MSRGFVIVAHNNEQVDYCTIALCNALMIKHNCAEKNVTLITDYLSAQELNVKHPAALVAKAFDKLVLIDHKKVANAQRRHINDTRAVTHNVVWYNHTRTDVYALSPYDETIVLDADYLVQDNRLDMAWGSKEDILINRDIISIGHNGVHADERRLEPKGIPLYWATLLYFRRSERSKLLFDTVAAIKDNYAYFQHVWQFPGSLYRNDYAFSIAIHMLSGFVESDTFKSFPVPTLFSSFDYDELIDIPARNELLFLVNHGADYMVSRAAGISVHCMNKLSIMRQASKIIEFYTE